MVFSSLDNQERRCYTVKVEIGEVSIYLFAAVPKYPINPCPSSSIGIP